MLPCAVKGEVGNPLGGMVGKIMQVLGQGLSCPRKVSSAPSSISGVVGQRANEATRSNTGPKARRASHCSWPGSMVHIKPDLWRACPWFVYNCCYSARALS